MRWKSTIWTVTVVGSSKHLLAWLLFLEHVEGVALSSPLRDAYSTYVYLLGALPLLLQASPTGHASTPNPQSQHTGISSP